MSQRAKIYYGWWIIGAVMLVAAYVGGVVVFSFTAVFEPIVRDFGWSYAQVSVAASIRGMETSVLAPVTGWMLDRFGPRKLIFIGVCAAGLGLLLLSRTNSLTTLYAASAITAIGVSACTGLVPVVVAGNWFRKNFTIAVGLASCGVALGGLFVPLVSRVVDAVQWRDAMLIFGIGALLIPLPISLMIRRRTAEDEPPPARIVDPGLATSTNVISDPGPPVEIGVKSALRNKVVWLLALCLLFHMFVVNTVLVHVMPYLSNIGISRTTASMVASALPVLSIIGRLSFGWLGDRHNRVIVTCAGFAILLASILTFSLVPVVGEWLLIPFLVLFGIGFGSYVPMMPALLRDHFGRSRLGTLMGIVSGIGAIGQMSGPPLAGLLFDITGNYQIIWFSYIGVALLGILSAAMIPARGTRPPTADIRRAA